MLLGHSAKALQVAPTQLHTLAATDSSLSEISCLALNATAQQPKLIKLIGALQQATTENKKITRYCDSIRVSNHSISIAKGIEVL